MSQLLKHLKDLSLTAFLKWVRLMLANPLKIIPTLKATLATLKSCEQLYPKESHRWAGNAYKHALWNMLVAKEVMGKNQNSEYAIAWAKTITDIHEDIIVNDAWNRAMDLHNNAVGRKLFLMALANNQQSKEGLVSIAKEKADQAQFITQINHFTNYPYDLVYIR